MALGILRGAPSMPRRRQRSVAELEKELAAATARREAAEAALRAAQRPPLGQAREKATLAMPAEMLDQVSDLVKERLELFGPHAEGVDTQDKATQLAKDLGK